MSETTHCLTSYLFPSGVMPLETETTYLIGRAEETDIQLPSGKVSREHAVIESTDGGYRIRDLDSKNGTRVNGLIVPEDGQPLSEQDEIAIGPFTLRYRAFSGDVSALVRPVSPQAETEAIPMPSATEESFSGSFDALGLIEVCQFLSHWRKEGILRVRSGDTKGFLVLAGGDVVAVDGTRDKIRGRTVELLSAKEGQFEFRSTIPEEYRKFAAMEPEPLLPILMELTDRRADKTPDIVVN